MATTLVEPFTPWLRGLGQVLYNQGTVGAFVPPADLLVDDDGVTVYMDVPGLRSDNLEIELENDVLTIRGDRPFPYAQDDGRGPVRKHRARVRALRAHAPRASGARSGGDRRVPVRRRADAADPEARDDAPARIEIKAQANGVAPGGERRPA